MYFCAIIMHMKYSSTEKACFLSKCFYLTFIETKSYKTDIENFIDVTNSGMSFRLSDFIGSRKNISKADMKTLGLIPIDAFYESECPQSVLDLIQHTFSKEQPEGGYTKLFLEYLFDEKFKTEFNILAKNKYSGQNSELVINNYFTTKTETGSFEHDLVGNYFNEIKSKYSNDGDFSFLTERKAVRSKKIPSERKDKLGIEEVNNLFSVFKLYGQGEYSKILISLLGESGNKAKCLEPDSLRNDFFKEIISDQEISKSIPNNYFTGQKKLSILESRIFEREYDKSLEELQRFFDDFKPSYLSKVFVLNGEKHKNETLRELLIRDFRGICKEEWDLYKKLNNIDLYEILTYRRNLFSNYEIEKIEEKYDELHDYTKRDGMKNEKSEFWVDKIKFILENAPSLQYNQLWSTIFEKYYEYYPVSLEDLKKEIQDEKNSFNCVCSDKEIVMEVFDKFFKGENQFLSYLESDIRTMDNFNIRDFLKCLKGKDNNHPWQRFWTVYNRNSEAGLYTNRRTFTATMNRIENEMKTYLAKSN